MGFKFRKSIKIGPARINLSKSGVGYSIGGKGLRVTKKAGGGTRTTVGISGTGISYSIDSSSKKSTNKASSSSSKTVTGGESTSSPAANNSSGCLIPCLCVIGVCLAIALLKNYFGVLLLLGLCFGCIFLLFRYFRGQKVPSAPATDTGEYPSSDIASAPQTEMDEKIIQFETELNEIPKVEITLSNPAERHLLKNLPEYTFSNITRKTRLDSIFPLVFLDVETTGFAPSKCEIVEVSAIKFETGMTPVAAFTTLCKPKKAIPEEASAVNHITDEMVADAPTFSQVAPALTEFMKGCHVAGHNLDFDLRFIFAHGADLPSGVRFYDTLDLARLTIPKNYLFDYKLDTVCRYCGIKRGSSHRALSDCFATSKVFSRLIFEKTSRQLDASAEILSEKNAE